MIQYIRKSINRDSFKRAVSLIADRHPEIENQLRETLAILMQDIVSSPDQEAAWNYSKLNSNGSPIEFTFSSMHDEVRYTVEVGGPDVQPEKRLTCVAQLLTQLGSKEPFVELVDNFQQVQSQGKLRWGAWLGVRHLPNQDEYKIYAEVPPESSDWAKQIVADYLGNMPRLPGDRDVKLVALGRKPGSLRCEFYFALSGRGLSEGELDHLLDQLDLQHRQQDLLELMGAAQIFTSKSDRPKLPSVEYGLSYSVLPGKQDPVFSIFTFASKYIGGDAFIRHQILVAALSRGWSLGAYPILTEPLACNFTRCVHHNVIAFIVAPEQHLGLHISLSPPFPN